MLNRLSLRYCIRLLVKPSIVMVFLYICSIPDDLYFNPPIWFYISMFILILISNLYDDFKK